MRGPASIVVLVMLCAAGLGCPPKASRSTSNTPVSSPSDGTGGAVIAPSPEDRGAPARTLGGGAAGVVLTLPRGWTALPVSGDEVVLGRAWGPPRVPVELELRRWDGDPDSLEPLLRKDPWSWSADGPYTRIEGADGQALVATFRESTGDDPSRDMIGFAWFFLVEGQGIGVVARVPATRMEAGFAAANEVVRTARAPGDAT